MIDKDKARQNGVNVIDTEEVAEQERAERLAELSQLAPSAIGDDGELNEEKLDEYVKGKLAEIQSQIPKEAQKQIDRLLHIRRLFPRFFNADNQINLSAIRDFLNLKNTTSNNKGYELTFAGKGIANSKAETPTQKELKAEIGQSKNFDNTGNVVIRGDNLDALKVLKQNYSGKIKVIYIDPPYNTQNENFVYDDNFHKNENALVEDLGLDKKTVDFLHNVYGTKSHSGWLAFMFPRLQLARDLLSEDGVIFISIDDNEVANLRVACSEIFGEENFVNTLAVKRGTKSLNSQFEKIKSLNQGFEYILAYRKSKEFCYLKPYKEANERRKEGYWTSLYNSPDRPTMRYEIKGINLERGQWKWSKEKGLKAAANYDKFLESHDEKDLKRYWESNKELDFVRRNGTKIEYWVSPSDFSIMDSNMMDHNIHETRRENKFSFSTVKNLSTIKKLVEMVTDKTDIVLDFFAGSGTIGDAVMRLNAEDGGDRKFILVQLDEEITEEKTPESYKFCIDKGHAPIISSITLERLKQAGKKIEQDWEKNAEQGVLCEEEFSSSQLPDLGYKVFSLVNKPQVANEGGIFKVSGERASSMDKLVNMLCATCKPLDTKIETLVEGKIYKAAEQLYIIDDVSPEELEAHKDIKINIDGWCNMDLQNWLNAQIADKDNITIIY